jgi:DNA-binding PadR family transcriptional regulator
MASKGATLELAVLGLLHESPLHGYELRKRLNLLLGWSRVLSYGSLYPALKRMLRAGWITEVTTVSPGVSRRQRIVYQIAPAGTEYFATAMTDSGPASWEDENFHMRFALFSRTDAAVRMRILEGRRSRLQERLDRASAATRGTDRYVTELQRHTLESMEREVRWLTELIDAEHGDPRPGNRSDTTGPQDPVVTPQTSRSAATAPAAARTEAS